MNKIKRLFLLLPIILCMFFIIGCDDISGNYTDDEWTITFQNYDGSFLAYTKVKDGEDAEYPGYPTPRKPSDDTHVYVFDGWDKPLTRIREDGIRIAKYRAENRYYTVTFKSEYKEIDKQKCLYGGSVTFHGVEPTKAPDSSGTYRFSGWSIKLDNITKDCVAEAQFTLIKNVYKWTFYDSDGQTILARVTVQHGDKPVYPYSTPTKESNAQYSYTFTGWDNINGWTKATSDGSSKAVYSSNLKSYNATFKNYDGTTLYTTSVKYGSAAKYSGANPTKPSTVDTDYTFSGWDKNLTITKDTEFIAQYKESIRSYKVSFVNDNMKELYSQMVPYGGSATYSGNIPTKESDGRYNYTFSNWNGDYSKIVRETIVVAEFTYSVNIDYFTFTLSSDGTYYIASLKNSGNRYTEFYVPDSYNELPVKEVSSLSTTYVQNIYLPNSIEKINNSAFYNSSSLKTISLGSSLTNIGSKAFQGCKSLETINLNEGLTVIGESAFNGCTKLAKITFPSTLEYLGADSFSSSGLINITIPENVITLYSAFRECRSLKSISINANVDTLPATMFKNCTSLNEIVIGPHIVKIGSEAFIGCNSLSTVAIPSNVTTILYDAFSQSGITSLVIPDTVTSLGTAFRNMSSLQKVTLNADITTINENSFYNCISLTEVIIGSHIKTISSNAFNGCKSLKTLDIPSNVTTISYDAFSNCGITSLIIPESVISLGSAFRNMSFLQKVTLNADVAAIPENAFYNCISLTEVIIGSHIKTISSNAFNGCKSLKNLDIPSSITTISYDAFSSCGITSLIIPESVISLGSAFRNMSFLQKVTLNADVTAIPENAFYNCTALTEVEIGPHITTIGSNTFNGCKSLKTLDIPSNVTSISYEAFSSCGITSLIIPESVISLGSAFRNMSSLQKVTLNADVTAIPENAFYNCTALTEVEIGPHITTIGSNTFNGCKSLKTLDIPSNVTSISYEAFSSCGITSLIIPESVISLGSAFRNMSFLQKVTLNADVTAIPENAFYNCTALTEVEIGPHITTIGSNTFNGCKSLKTLDIPSNVTSISYEAFSSCGITALEIPETVTSLSAAFRNMSSLQKVTLNANTDALAQNAFYNCTALTEVVIGPHIKTIGSNAFNGCKSLKTLDIPSNITNISYEAFSSCGITSLEIPETVTSLSAAFRNMSSLQKVTLNADITTINENSFYNCTSLTEIIIGPHITTIGSNAFNGCRSLKVLEIPSNVTNISYEAFSSCGITSLEIPETVTSLNATFRNMSSLQKVTLNANVDALAQNAFYNCTALTEVVIGPHITTIGPNAFNGCKLLKEIFIMNSEENITINDNNLDKVTKYYYSDEELEGNYWHYVDGVITKW